MTLGESLALFTPSEWGYMHSGQRLRLGFGGAESNVAIALSRLGTPSTWIGRVGSDSFGDMIIRQLRAENIVVHAVRDSAPTGLMFKEWAPGGALRVHYRRSASAGSRLCPADIDPELIEQASLLHLTGITPALSASASAAVQAAISIARSADIPISVDLNYRQALWAPEDARPALVNLLKEASIAFAGSDEAALALDRDGDTPAETLACELARLGPREVIIKRGSHGALAYHAGNVHHVDPFPVHAVDPVGAGDAFVGGYLSERIQGKAIDTCLATAAQVGAYACTVQGDWEGSARRHDLVLAPTADVVTR
ncbi:sugar kinase [Prescottella agglutinans]|uniref:sugar kinase n=1 Tax=Prescottella agglutinans TaxID=1644129 RepID=UPI002476BD04|nr:sugar kinase [Prescottella agglutinans]